MKHKSSRVWTYFTDLDADSAQCNLCHGIYSRKGRSTTSLKNHLRSTHAFEYAEFLESEEMARKQQQQPHQQQQQGMTKLEKARDHEEPSSSKSSGKKRKIATHSQLLDNEIEDINVDEVHDEELNDDEQSMSETLLTDEKTHWVVDHPKSQDMDRLITEMIAAHDLPMAFIEGAAFRRLLQAALPWYNLRDGQFFSQNMRTDVYPKLVRKIKSILKCFSSYTFSKNTCKVSSGAGHVWQLRYTCHGITPAFRRFAVMLKCVRLASREVVDYSFEDMLSHWEIPRERVHCLVYGGSAGDFDLDDGRKIRHANNKAVDCSIYELKLCVREAILAEKPIKRLIAKCDELAKEFHKDKYRMEIAEIEEQLHPYQAGLSTVKDISDAKRMKTPYHRLQHLLQLKYTICELMKTHANLKITPEEWKNMRQCVQVMQHFEDTVQIMSGSQTSVASVIPLVHALKRALQRTSDEEAETYDTSEMIKDFIYKLIEELNMRFGNLPNGNIYAIATYLDPRYKLKFFDDGAKARIQTEVLRPFAEPPKRDPLSRKRQKHSYDLNSNAPNTINTVLAEFLDSSSGDDDDDTTVQEIGLVKVEKIPDNTSKYKSMKALLCDYNKEPKLQISEDPLLWWKENTKYREFFNTARQYLAPPPGVSPTQTIFDKCASQCNDLSDIYHGISDIDEEKHFLLKHNLALLNFQY